MNAESVNARPIKSRGDFLEAARALLMNLPEVNARDLCLVDADFSPWPLGEPGVLDTMTQWVRLPGRRLRLIGGRFDVIARDQVRFAAWRKTFAHAVECLTPSEVEPNDMPALMLLGSTCLELLDRERWQGRCSDERRWVVAQRERIDALLQRCEPAWPLTVLGL